MHPNDSTGNICADCGVAIMPASVRCKSCSGRRKGEATRAALGDGPNPGGLCQCGCGQETELVTQTDSRRGIVRGQPRQYIAGHHRRKSPIPYVVDPDTGCWLWQRGTNPEGYGRMQREGRLVYPHRAFYEDKYGPIPEGMELDHVVCQNPPCCNPDHVEPVTHLENVRRAFRR